MYVVVEYRGRFSTLEHWHKMMQCQRRTVGAGRCMVLFENCTQENKWEEGAVEDGE